MPTSTSPSLSVEYYKVQSDGAGTDVINAGGSTATGAAFPRGSMVFAAGDFGIPATSGGSRIVPSRGSTAGWRLPRQDADGWSGFDRISGTGDGYNTVAPGAGDDYRAG